MVLNCQSMLQTIGSSRIKVSVGAQIFEIPSEKYPELLNILSSWQSIAVSEQKSPSPVLAYQGRTLING